MSVDNSLRLKSSLARHRNVLTRAERVVMIRDNDRWDDESTALGMPKVGHRKMKAGKKKPKREETADATA